MGVLQPSKTFAFQIQCLPSAFQQAKDLTQHDLSFTTLQAPLAFPTTKQSHPQPPSPPKKDIKQQKPHKMLCQSVLCFIHPVTRKPMDSYNPQQTPVWMLALKKHEKTWENQMSPCAFCLMNKRHEYAVT